MAANAVELQALVRAGDVVIPHGPQTAGLIPAVREAGATVVWRCHIGHERPDHPVVRRGWRFLERYLRLAQTRSSRPASCAPCSSKSA